MAIKLTPTRRRHLEAVRDYEVRRNGKWGGGFCWDAWGPGRQAGRRRWILRPSTMDWLLANGLIRVERIASLQHTPFRAVLTDAGREALEAGE